MNGSPVASGPIDGAAESIAVSNAVTLLRGIRNEPTELQSNSF